MEDEQVYDALVSADIVADDPDQAAKSLVDLFGLPTPRSSAILEPEGHGFRAIWVRVQPSLRQAPTQIEIICARPRHDPHDYVEERIAAQGRRPIRTHATVVAGDAEALVARLERNSIRHRVTPASDDFDFIRVWLGVTSDAPLQYQPRVDGGLWLEIVPTQKSGLPTEPQPAEPPRDDPSERPGVWRIRSRRFLVGDLDEAIDALETNLDWKPAGISDSALGRYAVFAPSNPLSATIELVQPRPASDLEAFHREWGDGPHAIVMEVGDLNYMESRCRERGVAATTSFEDGVRVLRPDTDATYGVPFELVEATH